MSDTIQRQPTPSLGHWASDPRAYQVPSFPARGRHLIRILLAVLVVAGLLGCRGKGGKAQGPTPVEPVQKVKQVPTKTLVKAKAPTPARPSKPAKSERQIARDKAEAGIKSFCGRCHAFPDPRQFTMETWMTAIRFKYKYFKKHKIDMAGAPPPREVMGYFAEFAARTLLIPSFETPDNFAVGPAISAIGRFEKTAVIADMVAVSPKDGFGGDVLVSDLLSGRIEAHSGKPGGKSKLIGQMTHPARMTVVDLDRDKRKDVIVAKPAWKCGGFACTSSSCNAQPKGWDLSVPSCGVKKLWITDYDWNGNVDFPAVKVCTVKKGVQKTQACH